MRSAKANSPSQAAIALRHGSSSFASCNVNVLGTACARHFARRLLQQAEQQLGLLAFYACGAFFRANTTVFSLLSFRPERSFLPSTRAKPWLLRERGAATKRSCKARLRGLLRAQFAATSAWRNPGASATDKRSVPLHHAPRNCRSVFRMSVRGQPINFNNFHRSAQFV